MLKDHEKLKKISEANKSINIFDFDGTLTTDTWPKFWVWVKKFGYHGEKRNDELENALALYRAKNKGTPLETFYAFFNEFLANNNATITHDELMEGEKYIIFNPGVKEFLNTSISDNYIVSGGLKEFLEGLKIASSFSGIYGTSILHDKEGLISGIGDIMTDDKKIMAIKDILKKHNRAENDCKDVFFIGDGYSDAPAMSYVHNNGGKAIFVHQPHNNDFYAEHNNQVFNKLNSEGIIDYCFIADYTENSKLFKILQRELLEDYKEE